MDLEDELKDALKVKRMKKVPGRGGGGSINQGDCYETGDNEFVFVKLCSKENANEIIAGEFESLRALKVTGCVRVPEPLAVVREPDSDRVALAMEFLEMNSLNKLQFELGEKIANLHQHNEKLETERVYKNSYLGQSVNNDESQIYVDEFGFDSVTCCGAIAMDNEFCSDWESFFARNRLQPQIKLIEDNYGDRLVTELWSELQLKISKYFRHFAENDIKIKPSLLHGDLWSGNVAEVGEEPVIFDPACFYGHSEYDLSISDMFGGFRQKFYDGYRTIIKKDPGFEKRIQLYQLFHYLNHWNHFGGDYKTQSLSLMKKLNKIV